jgi:hypothetical protein
MQLTEHRPTVLPFEELTDLAAHQPSPAGLRASHRVPPSSRVFRPQAWCHLGLCTTAPTFLTYTNGPHGLQLADWVLTITRSNHPLMPLTSRSETNALGSARAPLPKHWYPNTPSHGVLVLYDACRKEAATYARFPHLTVQRLQAFSTS